MGSTRARIAENFLEIFNVEAVNHVSFNDSGAGKHKFMQMPEQPSAPTTAVNETALYTKQGTNPAEATIFARAESNGFEYQLTKPIAAYTATFAANSTGWTFLPGGLLLLYGIVAPTSSSTIAILFSGLGLPDFNSVNYTVQLTPQRTTSNPGSESGFFVDNTTILTTGFSIRNISTHTYGYYWWAIGL